MKAETKKRAGGTLKYRAKARRGEQLNRVAFPLGGLGAGMMSLEGTGAISQMSLRHKPEVYHEPAVLFGALHVKSAKTARVVEGPVPMWKAFGQEAAAAGNGLNGRSYGLPRFAKASFTSAFPFAEVALADPNMPVVATIRGWSPFTPGNADDSSLPVAALEYVFRNRTRRPVKAVFSYHAKNFLKLDDGARVEAMDGGFVLVQPPVEGKPDAEASFAVATDEPAAKVDAAWFRGGWFDALTTVWNHIAAGDVVAQAPHAEGRPGAGGSLYVPFTLKAGATKTIRVRFAWHVPSSAVNVGSKKPAIPEEAPPKPYHRPWYSAHFKDVAEVAEYWRANYARLRAASETFSACFHDTTLPAEVVESVAANLSILKSPTCLRQADGRFWGWEGCCGGDGCCSARGPRAASLRCPSCTATKCGRALNTKSPRTWR